MGIALLGTIGVGATAETFEDALPAPAASCVLLLLFGAGFALLEIAIRRACALADKSQPSELKVAPPNTSPSSSLPLSLSLSLSLYVM